MRARTFITLATLFLIAPIGGCGLSSAERIAVIEQTVATLQDKSAQLDTTITALEQFLGESQTLLADPNLPPESVDRIAAAVVQAQDKLAEVKAVKGKVDTGFVERSF